MRPRSPWSAYSPHSRRCRSSIRAGGADVAQVTVGDGQAGIAEADREVARREGDEEGPVADAGGGPGGAGPDEGLDAVGGEHLGREFPAFARPGDDELPMGGRRARRPGRRLRGSLAGRFWEWAHALGQKREPMEPAGAGTARA